MVSRLLRRRSSGPDGLKETDYVTVTATASATNMKKSTERSKPSRTRQRQRQHLKKFPFFSRNKPNTNCPSSAGVDGERRDEAFSLSSNSSSASGCSNDVMPPPPPVQRPEPQILVSSTASPVASHSGYNSNKPRSKKKMGALQRSHNRAFCSSFQHSYLEQMCGVDTTPAAIRKYSQNNNDDENSTDSSTNYLNQVPEDPSVQESIECVLAATQVAASMRHLDKDEVSSGNEADDGAVDPFSHLQTPSSLQQCLLKNRSISALPPRLQSETRLLSPRPMTQQQQWPEQPMPSLTSIGSTQSFNAATAEAKAHVKATTETHHIKQCVCCEQRLPVMEPDRWPQRPLLMRPTPHSGTVIQGIRYAGSTEYLWKAQTSPLQWPNALHEKWRSECRQQQDNTTMIMCPQCMIMPINNGKELPGESLVTDFESPGFVGSILVRLRDSRGTTCPGHERVDGQCYFDGVHRKYQVVVRGRFKHAVPWTDCLAGFQLERPCGKLPPKWIVKGALNVVTFFAPHLQTRIHGPRPFSLTPLGSTPQSLSVLDTWNEESKTDTHMEIPLEEPFDANCTLLGKASTASSSMQRARFRKKNFDKLFATGCPKPLTDPNKVYTFEFLQHLLSFDDFEIQLGSIMGTIHLKDILDGQPLQIMASHKHPNPNQPNAVHNRLWCFDIWHEMLIPDAKRHEFGV